MTNDCLVDTPPRDWREARRLLDAHAGHDPRCLRDLTAGAYLSASNGEVD